MVSELQRELDLEQLGRGLRQSTSFTLSKCVIEPE